MGIATLVWPYKDSILTCLIAGLMAALPQGPGADTLIHLPYLSASTAA